MKLLYIAIFSISLSQILGQDVIVPTDHCAWRAGGYGVSVHCEANELAIGSCGSGRDADCAWISNTKDAKIKYSSDTTRDSGIYHGLFCCDVPGYLYDNDFCQTHNGHYGENLSCSDLLNNDNWILEGSCGSGRDQDCSGFTHQIKCCEGTVNAIALQSTGQCEWKFGGYGEEIACSFNNQAIFGRCGSGRDPDCNAGRDYHGIQCSWSMIFCLTCVLTFKGKSATLMK